MSPLYVNLNPSILSKLSLGDFTSFLSVKNMHITARLKYIEHKTPKSDENLSALTFLGMAIGKSNPKENRAAEILFPVSCSPIVYSNNLSVEYLVAMLGMAFFI